MGEQKFPANENNIHNGSEDQEMPLEPENEEDVDDFSPEEIAALDKQLDVLNSALDDIEQKNDTIHAQLVQLLNSNREMRQQQSQSPTTIENAPTSPKTD